MEHQTPDNIWLMRPIGLSSKEGGPRRDFSGEATCWVTLMQDPQAMTSGNSEFN